MLHAVCGWLCGNVRTKLLALYAGLVLLHARICGIFEREMSCKKGLFSIVIDWLGCHHRLLVKRIGTGRKNWVLFIAEMINGFSLKYISEEFLQTLIKVSYNEYRFTKRKNIWKVYTSMVTSKEETTMILQVQVDWEYHFDVEECSEFGKVCEHSPTWFSTEYLPFIFKESYFHNSISRLSIFSTSERVKG